MFKATKACTGVSSLAILSVLATSSAFGITVPDGGTTKITALVDFGADAASIGTGATLEVDLTDSLANKITGRGALLKSGSSTLTLLTTNDYTGATTVSGGTLILNGNGSIATSSGLTLGAGTTFNIAAVSDEGTTVKNLTGSGNVTLGSKMLTVATDADSAYAGVISGNGALIKTGDSKLTLDGVNTYTGQTILSDNGGTLILNGNGSIANSSSLSLLTSTTLDIANANDGATVKQLFGRGNVVLGDKTLTVSDAGTYAGGISGTGGLTKTGTSKLTLGGATTYTGQTTVSAGTLALGTNGSIASSSDLSLGRGTTFDIAGVNTGATVKNLTGSGNVTLGSKTLTAEIGKDSTHSGVISGTGALTKTGANKLTLDGVNTYTGATTVNAGTLALNGDGSIASSSDLSLGRGTTFDIAGVNTGATVKNLTGSGNVTLGSKMLTVATDADSAYAGVISGTGALTKTGNSKLTLDGTNTYTGATTVSGGTLALDGDGSIATSSDLSLGAGTIFDITGLNSIGTMVKNLTGSGDVTLGSKTLTAEIGKDSTHSGVISGTGALTKTGANKLTLDGTNTYTGATTVKAGTLSAGSNIASSSGLALYGGATFNNTGGHSLNSKQFVVDVSNGSSAHYNGALDMQKASVSFILPEQIASLVPSPSQLQTALEVSEAAKVGGSDISIDASGVRDGLQVGDHVTLISKTDGAVFNLNHAPFAPDSNDAINGGQWEKGLLAGGYKFKVTLSGEKDQPLGAEVTSASQAVRDDAGSVRDAVTAATGTLIAAQNLVAAAAGAEARTAAGLDSCHYDDNRICGGAFAASTGGQLRYRTNGHTTLNGMSLLGGLSIRAPLPAGQAMAGAFIESGWGNYKGHSNQDIRSNGNVHYYGGGVLGRYEWSGFYAEGSGRIGRAKTSYASTLTDGTENAHFDHNNTYYGLHGGVGYVLPLTHGVNVDLSSKYFWTHQDGSNVNVLGSEVQFGAVNSQRWRSGARVNIAADIGVVPYVGAYYEHEFDAKAKATTAGLDIPGPSLKGGTGVAELGVTFGAAADAYRVDVGVTGYAGKYSGATGSIKAKWGF